MIVYTEIDNPIVNLAVAGDEQGIRRIHFLNGNEKKRWAPEPEWRRDDRARALRSAVRELEAYFAGELRQFSLPLAPVGTPFQLDVWNALRAIPYGETRSYGELARAHRPAERGARGGRRQRRQPAADRGAVPSRDRLERQPHRLRRRTAAQAGAARARARHARRPAQPAARRRDARSRGRREKEPVTSRAIEVFFYGLFMDVERLRRQGMEPARARRAYVDAFGLRIGQRATLVPERGARAYGMLMALAHDDVARLYAAAGLERYRPEAVLVHCLEDEAVVAGALLQPSRSARRVRAQSQVRGRAARRARGSPVSAPVRGGHRVRRLTSGSNYQTPCGSQLK